MEQSLAQNVTVSCVGGAGKNMTTVCCPICGERMENSKYSEHMAWKHPETNSEYIRPIVTGTSKEVGKVKILDEDDGSHDE